MGVAGECTVSLLKCSTKEKFLGLVFEVGWGCGSGIWMMEDLKVMFMGDFDRKLLKCEVVNMLKDWKKRFVCI